MSDTTTDQTSETNAHRSGNSDDYSWEPSLDWVLGIVQDVQHSLTASGIFATTRVPRFDDEFIAAQDPEAVERGLYSRLELSHPEDERIVKQLSDEVTAFFGYLIGKYWNELDGTLPADGNRSRALMASLKEDARKEWGEVDPWRGGKLDARALIRQIMRKKAVALTFHTALSIASVIGEPGGDLLEEDWLRIELGAAREDEVRAERLAQDREYAAQLAAEIGVRPRHTTTPPFTIEDGASA